MGKGDKKSKRGKITMGTFGVRRPRKRNKPNAVIIVPEKKAKAISKTETKSKTEPKAKSKAKTAVKK